MDCLKCKNCLVCNDGEDSMSAMCTASKAQGMLCKEISYLMPLGYDSSYADAPLPNEPWIDVMCDSLYELTSPDWCPGYEEGDPQVSEQDAIEVMKAHREKKVSNSRSNQYN